MASLRQLRKRAEKPGHDAKAWYDYAVALAKDRKLPNAHEALVHALECPSITSDLCMSIGLSLQGMQDEQNALVAYHRGTLAGPNHAQVHLRFGALLRSLGRPEDGIESLGKALYLSDFSLEACLEYSAVCEGLDRLDDASMYAYMALDISPDNAQAYRQLGRVATRLGHAHTAIRALERVSELEPGDLQVKTMLGISLSRIGNHSQAVKYLTDVAAAQPDSVDAFSDLGMALSHAGNHDAAIHALKQAIKLAPESAETHLNFGAALMAAQRPQEATSAFWKVTSIAPEWSLAHYNTGLALRTLGDLAGAVEAFQQAVLLDPDDPKLQTALMEAQVQLTDSERKSIVPAPSSSSPSYRHSSKPIPAQLKNYPLTGVLERLRSSKATGTLAGRSKSMKAEVLLANGQLLGGDSPRAQDVPSILVQLNVITQDDLEMTFTGDSEHWGLERGLMLVQYGIVAPSVFRDAVRIQIQTVLLDILSCKEEDLVFTERDIPFSQKSGTLPFTPIDPREALIEVVSSLEEPNS